MKRKPQSTAAPLAWPLRGRVRGCSVDPDWRFSRWATKCRRFMVEKSHQSGTYLAMTCVPDKRAPLGLRGTGIISRHRKLSRAKAACEKANRGAPVPKKTAGRPRKTLQSKV